MPGSPDQCRRMARIPTDDNPTPVATAIAGIAIGTRVKFLTATASP